MKNRRPHKKISGVLVSNKMIENCHRTARVVLLEGLKKLIGLDRSLKKEFERHLS